MGQLRGQPTWQPCSRVCVCATAPTASSTGLDARGGGGEENAPRVEAASGQP